MDTNAVVQLRKRVEERQAAGAIDARYAIDFDKLGPDPTKHDALLASLERMSRGEGVRDANTAKVLADYPGTAELYATRLVYQEPDSFMAGTLGSDFDVKGMPAFLHLHHLEDFDVLAQMLPHEPELRDRLTRLQDSHALAAQLLRDWEKGVEARE